MDLLQKILIGNLCKTGRNSIAQGGNIIDQLYFYTSSQQSSSSISIYYIPSWPGQLSWIYSIHSSVAEIFSWNPHTHTTHRRARIRPGREKRRIWILMAAIFNSPSPDFVTNVYNDIQTQSGVSFTHDCDIYDLFLLMIAAIAHPRPNNSAHTQN